MNCLVYTAFEFVGAALAAGVFYATHPSEYDKGALRAHSLRDKEYYGTSA